MEGRFTACITITGKLFSACALIVSNITILPLLNIRPNISVRLLLVCPLILCERIAILNKFPPKFPGSNRKANGNPLRRTESRELSPPARKSQRIAKATKARVHRLENGPRALTMNSSTTHTRHDARAHSKSPQ